jgi:hypothetical protein
MIPFVSLVALAAVAVADAPLQLETRILTETPGAAGAAPVLAPARRTLPGDPLVVELAYRNAGSAAITGLVLANPVPRGIAYRAPHAASPAPELSVDGNRFGPLAALTVALPGGGTRPATADDVTHVRWRLPAALAAGGSGRLGFRAVVR